MHHIFAIDPFESVLISRLLLTPVNGSTRFYPDLFYLGHGTTRTDIMAQSYTHAGSSTCRCICSDLSWICVNVYCRQAKVSVVVASKGKWGCGAPGWAGIPHVDVQSLENNLESRPRGVMVAARRWPSERGPWLCFYSACLLKSHVSAAPDLVLSRLSRPPVFVTDLLTLP